MNFRFMIDTAVDAIRKRYDKRHNPVVGDTVCVICAGNGNIYTGNNEYVTSGDVSENVHAEIQALKKMQADGQTAVRAITVFNSCNVSPILPCNGCINYILSLDRENIKTLVVTPNGNMFITDVGRFAAGTDNLQTRRAENHNYSIYTNVPEHNRGASLYMNSPGMFGQSMNMQYSMNISANVPVNNQSVFPGAFPESYNNINNFNNTNVAENTANNHKNPDNTASAHSIRPNQNGVNKLLKNKISNLLDDE